MQPKIFRWTLIRVPKMDEGFSEGADDSSALRGGHEPRRYPRRDGAGVRFNRNDFGLSSGYKNGLSLGFKMA